MICVSYSGMNLYDQCPSAFARKYIRKEETLGDGKPSQAAMRGTRVHRDVELFLKGEVEELPDEALGFEDLFVGIRNEREPVPEKRWAFSPEWELVDFSDKEKAQVRGILDIVYSHEGTCYVMELKTGKKYEDHATQRSLYGLAGALLYPDCENTVVQTIYLDGGMVDETQFMGGQIESYKWVWQRLINKTQPPQPYPQRPSWKCRFCPYHEDQGGTCNGERT